jgi:hypothetical protein
MECISKCHLLMPSSGSGSLSVTETLFWLRQYPAGSGSERWRSSLISARNSTVNSLQHYLVYDTLWTDWLALPFSIWKIRLKESNAKCRYQKQYLTCKGTFEQLFIHLRPPSILGFCLGWSSNFVGSESGQKQSVKLLQNMVSNTIQHPGTPSQPHAVLWLWEGGGGEPERRLEGQKYTKLGKKFQQDWLCLQSVKSIKHQ